jgi:sugar phosphate isomerase/epimerase
VSQSSVTRDGSTPVALSTSSVYPEPTPDAFELAARVGYDGVEVMVYTDPVSQHADVLKRLADYHQVPVLAVHAPSLLLTQRVWGREPWGKLIKAKELAEELGARTVVVHPPFRWQREYVKGFETGIQRMENETDVIFAVENMFPIRSGTAEVTGYAPSWDPTALDVPNVTLDLSHTAASNSDGLAMANDIGSRLAHLHLADGSGLTNRALPDEHLVPGRGRQPCAAVLRGLTATGFRGVVVVEVNTRKAATRDDRIADLTESLAYARTHLAPAGVNR